LTDYLANLNRTAAQAKQGMKQAEINAGMADAVGHHVPADVRNQERPARRSRYVNHLYDLLDEYIRSVEGSRLAPSSKVDYTYFASAFVNWCAGDYEPGQGVR
jgi:hypothetical protein